MSTEHTAPAEEDPAQEATAARTAMVARLGLQPGPVRSALLAIPREVLMPQAYVRRSEPEESPRWDLLDWSLPGDREEMLRLLYGGESVLIQHDGEPLLGRVPGQRSGGRITSMSSTVGMTAELLQELDLWPGQRVLDIGTGAGVTAAVACTACGDRGVVTLERDQHASDAAGARLADLGFQPTVATGAGEDGWPQRAPYDRVFVSYAIRRVPRAWWEQLGRGGRLLATLSGTSPSWPGLAVISKSRAGRVDGELRAVEFGHRPGRGFERIFISRSFLDSITAGEGGRIVRTRQAPPPNEPRALWLALEALRPGLVRNWSADHLVIGAPACGSWLIARPDACDGWAVTARGPRDIWEEIQSVAARWRAAGSPASYRLHFDSNGEQWVGAGSGAGELTWKLPHSTSTDPKEARP